MAIRKKPKERLPERRHPGDPEAEPCSPGSIEQELDMCENGSLRGDDILHSHGRPAPPYTGMPRDLTQVINETWRTDLSEEDREGDEMSGDEHSSGMSGGDTEFEGAKTDARSEEILTHPEEKEIPLTPRGAMKKARQCEVCRNEYDRTFTVILDGKKHEFDCFECAIHALCPRCTSCGVPVVGHGAEAGGAVFCSASCARRSGQAGLRDRTERRSA